MYVAGYILHQVLYICLYITFICLLKYNAHTHVWFFFMECMYDCILCDVYLYVYVLLYIVQHAKQVGYFM